MENDDYTAVALHICEGVELVCIEFTPKGDGFIFESSTGGPDGPAVAQCFELPPEYADAFGRIMLEPEYRE